MTANVTMGFVLPCRICGQEFMVGRTKEFEEARSSARRLAYFAPDAASGDRPVGYSSGDGDSFACKHCHAAEWASKYPEAEAAATEGATP